LNEVKHEHDLAALLTDTPTSEAAAATSSQPSAPGSGSDYGPATSVQLSDKVKAILSKAKNDEAVAERLKAFVQAHRTTAGGANSSSDGDASQTTTHTVDVNLAFDQLTDSKAQQDASSADTFEPVKPLHDFSNGVKFDGFTVGAIASAETGSSRVEMVGPDGLSYFDAHFGWSDEFVTGNGSVPGMTLSAAEHGNVEYLTISENEATATSASVSTTTQSASASAASSYSSQITFAIDFSSGAIRVTQSQAYAATAATETGQPTSPVSVIA
jgi:hypothetical protein